MNAKRLRVVIAVGVLFFAVGVEAAKPPTNPLGAFDEADFLLPSFANGDAVTVTAGGTRTLTASCTCARQPGNAPCSGSIVVEMNDGDEFQTLFSDACTADEGEACVSAQEHLFDDAGVFEFRIVCDESDGSAFTQPSSEHVTVTVDGTVACTDGETRPCPLQDGVCAGTFETCTDGAWLECTYDSISGFEQSEGSCDGLDNDCDGRVDFVDADGDGYGSCVNVPGVVNELLLTNSNGDGGSIQIFEYRNGAYQEAWSTSTPDVNSSSGGGEMGDLDGDGMPEFVVQRIIGSASTRFEVWTFNGALGTWYRMWMSPTVAGYGLHIGDIADFDNDGTNEILVTDTEAGQVNLYSYDDIGFAVESTVRTCTNERGALFLACGGDLDGDGTPEIIFQCDTPDDIVIQEYDEETRDYPVVASVPVPFNLWGAPMIVDDMEAGDVNGDGVDDVVFCGNSGQGHVLTVTSEGTYVVEYSSPPPSEAGVLSQTCSIGDMTNDGALDFLVVNQEGAKVYSHPDLWYQEVWVGSQPTTMPPAIGASFIGDSDNDGFTEFLFGRSTDDRVIALFENDTANASDFHEGELFELVGGTASIIVGNLNPTNDTEPVDCDDKDPLMGAFEICGDGLDNDCDTGVDEDCPVNFCGDNYCAGEAAGEMCTACPDDCGCFGPACKLGCCGDGVCDRKENASNCPVDCSL